LRFLWRIFMLVALIFLLKGVFNSEPQAYILWPEEKLWIQRVGWEFQNIQRAAQDLPASLEVVIRRLFRDIKPQVEAKSV
jgi:hypothetical protein